MYKLLLVLTIVCSAAVGCDTSSDGGGGSGGAGGAAGTGGVGGQGGEGGTTASCDTPQEVLRCNKVLNIAHRGGRRIRPEHTIVAYDQALLDGSDVLELDVHETSDGVLVVMHDDTVDRTTDCTGLIREMTFAALQECDAGYEFTTDGGMTYPYRGMGLVVPSLEEVFERYTDAPFVIEIKQEAPSIVESFVDLVREYGVEDKMVGAAFDDAVLLELRAAAPEIATSLGQGETTIFYLRSFDVLDPTYEPPGEFLQVPPTFNLEGVPVNVLHDGFVPRAHELGMFVHVWTINDEQEMRDLIELEGVDGIITDDPPLLTSVIEDLAN
ncbi:MAG TPA: glycerophosphodiester phosphodiesterase [Polyangiales bacterium]|nr:glycerophosphodiester phosphodiesterase [Polyangiales bacterium]